MYALNSSSGVPPVIQLIKIAHSESLEAATVSLSHQNTHLHRQQRELLSTPSKGAAARIQLFFEPVEALRFTIHFHCCMESHMLLWEATPEDVASQSRATQPNTSAPASCVSITPQAAEASPPCPPWAQRLPLPLPKQSHPAQPRAVSRGTPA